MTKPESRDIVIISSIDWSRNWQIHQQLASSLVEAGHRVLFIENTGVRPPRSGDYQRVTARLKRWFKSTRGFSDVRDKLTIYSPLFIPLPYSRWALLVNRLMLSSTIGKWLKISGFNQPIVITFLPTPLAKALIEDMEPRLTIYYCANDMAGGSEGAAPLRSYETAFFQNVQAVFCNSHALLDTAKQFNAQCYLFPAGVDYDKFAKAQNNQTRPADLEGLTGPILGYVGSISHVFDQPLIVKLCQDMPEAQIVLVGPISTDISKLDAITNLHILGAKPHDQIPQYISSFDVALIPYLVNSFSDAVYSCKLNEYLCVGTPTVTTNLRELRLYRETYGPVLTIGNNHFDFVEQVRAALHANTPAQKALRINAARENSWPHRFKAMTEAIDELLSSHQPQNEHWEVKLISLSRQFRRRLGRILLIGALGYGFIFHSPLFWWLGNALVVEQPPSPADAIVVFSGDGEPGYTNMGYQDRVRDAKWLYEAGYANKIIVSSGKGKDFSEASVVRALLIEQGVPAKAIEANMAIPSSTYQNVQSAATILKRENIKRILFVTGPYHSKRAQLVWQKAAPELMIAIPARQHPPPGEQRWGMPKKMIGVIAYEYLAIVYYRLKGWI